MKRITVVWKCPGKIHDLVEVIFCLIMHVLSYTVGMQPVNGNVYNCYAFCRDHKSSVDYIFHQGNLNVDRICKS